MRALATALLLCVCAGAADVIVTTQPTDPKPPAPGGVRVLVNQVGYDTGAPKMLLVQSDTALPARFTLLDAHDMPVFEAALAPVGRVVGAYGTDWGFDYAQGDFSTFDTPGAGYRVRVEAGGAEVLSPPFAIGPDLLWRETAAYAIAFFYYQRCGYEIPGFHKACHLDDGVSEDRARQHDLHGGWHDAGDYNKYQNAPYVYGLARAYGWRRAEYDALPPDLKKVIDAHSGAQFSQEIGKIWDDSQAAGRKLAQERGNTFYTIPASELQNWVQASQPLYRDFVADMDKKGLPGQQMLQDARELLQKYKK